MHQPPGPAIDQRQRRRDQRMVRGPEANLLREGQPKNHPRLAIVGQSLAGRAVDQRVEIRQPAQRFAGDRHREPMVLRRQVADRAAGGVERLTAPQHRVEHLQRRTARTNTLVLGSFNAWHEASRCS